MELTSDHKSNKGSRCSTLSHRKGQSLGQPSTSSVSRRAIAPTVVVRDTSTIDALEELVLFLFDELVESF